MDGPNIFAVNYANSANIRAIRVIRAIREQHWGFSCTFLGVQHVYGHTERWMRQVCYCLIFCGILARRRKLS